MVSARRPRGFTLIELMISMALSTVGLLGLLALQMIAINGNMRARNFGEALGIAQERLESSEHLAYASLSTLAESPTGTAGISPTTDLVDTTSPQAIYTRVTKVTVNADDTTDLEVIVSWNDTRNQTHAVKLVTKRSP
jgi:prepilin-type N-terminal cleavage/methylation domain-containing protein